MNKYSVVREHFLLVTKGNLSLDLQLLTRLTEPWSRVQVTGIASNAVRARPGLSIAPRGPQIREEVLLVL